MISKVLNSRIFLILISVILALILFANATSTTARNEGKNQTDGQVFSAILVDVPIDIKYNADKYFISGYTSTATITLTSYNQIELLQEKSADKRTFRVVADLTKLGVGTHTVPITIDDMDKTVNVKTNPSSMTVTIEEKETKSFKINPIVDTALIPDGYRIVSVTSNTNKVEVTAGTSSIRNIAKIEAELPSGTDLKSETTVTATAGLVAVDETGKIVPAKMDRSTVRMTVEIAKIKEKTDSSSSTDSTSASSSSSN